VPGHPRQLTESRFKFWLLQPLGHSDADRRVERVVAERKLDDGAPDKPRLEVERDCLLKCRFDHVCGDVHADDVEPLVAIEGEEPPRADRNVKAASARGQVRDQPPDDRVFGSPTSSALALPFVLGHGLAVVPI
jgi:hypothetical protein